MPIVHAVLLSAALAAGIPSTPADVGGLPLERLFPGASFDAAIPTQEKVLGFLPGTRPMRHDELMRYLEALAGASRRVRIVEYARSWEGRPLVLFAVSDEGTVARLDSFRAEHAAAMDPRKATAPPMGKAVAWMAYGIHGDEVSSTDAAAALAYRLVAGEDDWARSARRDLVVLIDPCENPDGRDRFLQMTRSFAHLRPNPDMSDLSHTAIWPQGRGNHFLFDLNRDWFSQVHPESRRSGAIASWAPQLVVDSHEMGADDTYLFSPSRHPFNPWLPPGNAAWHDRYAADQAKALDARGYPFYTREWNEEFFPGYGSSYASYLGAIGILYEMSGTDGTLVQQTAGTVRTYAQAVEHQTTSSIANLTTLLNQKNEALGQTFGARREAVKQGTTGAVRGWIFPPGSNPERADALAAVLRGQGIEVRRLEAPVKVPALRDARTGEVAARELPAGTWLVPIDQPAGLLARVILDPHVPMENGFLREEREYLERGKGSRLYDATGWSLPLVYGVQAHAAAAAIPGSWSDAPPLPPQGAVVGARPEAVGYLFDGTEDRALFALADLLRRGVVARVAEKPFDVEGRGWPRGTVLLQREGNVADLDRQLTEVAARWGVTIRATGTAKAASGSDLGGRDFDPLRPPRIGVFTGPAVASTSYGFIWHLLDAEADQRFTALDLSQFGGIDLARFNVLVLPPAGGGPDVYRAILGKPGLERLKSWVEAGGTLVGIGSGALLLADKDAGLSRVRARSQALDRFPTPVWSLSVLDVHAAGPTEATGIRAGSPEPAASGAYDVAPVLGPGARPFADGKPQGTPLATKPVVMADWLKPVLPPGSEKPKEEELLKADARLREFGPAGSILRLEADRDSWLAWGIDPTTLGAWVRPPDAFVAEPPVEVAARFADLERLHLGGLLWPEGAARWARTAYATRESVGRGQVILFADHPVFRGWTLGTRRLFLNALIYGPGLGTRGSAPW